MPPGANYARHLGDALDGIGNEENHQRHDGGIERVSRERKRHGIALAKLRHAHRGPRSGVCELRLGRIDPLNLGRRAPPDEQLGERTVAAADIDPAQARRLRQPIEEHLAREPAPRSHVPFVCGAVVEADI